MARSSWLTSVCITLMAQASWLTVVTMTTRARTLAHWTVLLWRYSPPGWALCYCERTVQLSLSNHCCICFLGDSVEIAEEEEQAESWEAGKYKCWNVLVLLWWHTCTVQLPECCRTVITHVHIPAGWPLHYFGGRYAQSSWLSAVVLWSHMCTFQLADHFITLVADMPSPAG
jgi:hypothetical protein